MKTCKECGYAHNHANNRKCQECKRELTNQSRIINFIETGNPEKGITQ